MLHFSLRLPISIKNLGLYFILIPIIFVTFLHADCGNGWMLSQRRRCQKGTSGFQARPGWRDNKFEACAFYLTEISNPSSTEQSRAFFLAACADASHHLDECHNKSNIRFLDIKP